LLVSPKPSLSPLLVVIASAVFFAIATAAVLVGLLR